MSDRSRLVAWYVVSVGALAGIPFVAPVLADRHVPDATIAAILTVQPVAVLIAAPTWAWIADRTGRTRPLLIGLSLVSAVGLFAVSLPLGTAGAVAAMTVYALSRSPQAPLVDALAVRVLPDGGRQYGRVRLWGSLAFLVGAGLFGVLRSSWGAAPVVLGASLLLLTAIASARLPDLVVDRRPSLADAAALLLDRRRALLGAAAVLHGLGLAFYNVFFARHVELLGLGSHITGLSLVVAVGVEVAVMAVAPRLLARVDPSWLLLVAFAATAPRWFGTAWVTGAAAMVALQALHGLSFGLFWVAAVPAFAHGAPAHVARSAQALLPATAYGIGPLIGLLLAAAVLKDHPPAVLFTIGGFAALGAAVLMAPLVRARPGYRDGRPW